MSFNSKTTLNDMAKAAVAVFAGELPKVRDCVEKALREEGDVLAEIGLARANGKIDEAEFQSQLKDERDTLEAVLLVCKIEAKVMTQEAINAALKVLETAVEAALKAV